MLPPGHLPNAGTELTSLVNSALTGVLFTAVSLEKHSKKLPDTIYLIFYA